MPQYVTPSIADTGAGWRGGWYWLVSPADLLEELSTGPRDWSARLRPALRDVWDNAHSVAEAEAIDALREAEVPAFEVNVPLVGSGAIIAVGDIVWRALRAVLEVDSREFHFDELNWKRTSQRHNRLTAAGLTLMHYPPSVIGAANSGWIDEVAAWLRHRADELDVPYDLTTRGAIRSGPAGPRPLHLA